MELLIEIVIWWALGYVAARLLLAWLDFRLTQKLEKEITEIIQDLDTGKLIPLTVELHNDQYFCYNSITQDFVCQGNTLPEIAQRFSLRYPDRKATIHRGDATVIDKLKKQLQDDIKNISLVSKNEDLNRK